MIEETYQGGRDAWGALCTSPHLAWVPRDVAPQDAARLFLPPVNEIRMEMTQPLPKKRREFINGFEDARAESMI